MLIWQALSELEQQAALKRPAVSVQADVEKATRAILDDVQQQGDAALKNMAAKFDGRDINAPLLVPAAEIASAEAALSPALKAAIDTAYSNIRTFHEAQLPSPIRLETMPGVRCELRFEAIESVGIYVPGGSAPLPSSVLMQGVLAQLSGAKDIVLATPVKGDTPIHPAILYAAKRCGISTILQVGGAGAIAAMAYGTESITKVNKIFGPGNAFVTMAKQLVAQNVPGLAIDMPAGPSEVLVIADERANPAFIAADLLSQAEHGPDSQVILLTNSEAVATATQKELDEQVARLSRKGIAEAALANSSLIVTQDLDQAFAISNEYGPEHLILQIKDAERYVDSVKAAGSIFVGDYTPESVGDYASGTNHVLPTYGYSKVYSSLSLLDFFRTYTVQSVSKAGLATLSSAILPLADAEGLDAHANAVSIRLKEQN